MAAQNSVLSFRLTKDQKRRLVEMARRWGRTPAVAGARAIEEALRHEEFAGIEYRSTPAGRLAYVAGTRTAVWLVAGFLRDCDGDVTKAAKLLHWPTARVEAAVNYARAFPEEINALIRQATETGVEALRRKLPNLETTSSSRRSRNGKVSRHAPVAA